VVGDARGNITDVKTLSRTRDFFEMAFDVEVFDARHLSNIVSALKPATGWCRRSARASLKTLR
jgi:guanosine-3',5'-bis(diphosphate) 3'-pyrophosphohydrolase